jgi:hypothetical protein
MLLWLTDAASVDHSLATASREASVSEMTLMQKSAAIRKIVPWETVAAALWPAGPPTTRSIQLGGIRHLFWFVLAWAQFRRWGVDPHRPGH